MIDFHALRLDPKHHLGLGDIRLTIGQQAEIKAEIDRLRGLVRTAFYEGFHASRWTDYTTEDEAKEWMAAASRKALNP